MKNVSKQDSDGKWEDYERKGVFNTLCIKMRTKVNGVDWHEFY